jgi:hypothetical protein
MKLEKVIKRARAFAEPFCITDGDRFRLKDVDPNDTLKFSSEDKPRAKEALAIGVEALAELQDMLYARHTSFRTLPCAQRRGCQKVLSSLVER